MIIGNVFPVGCLITAEDCVRKRISGAFDLPAAINEGMRMVSSGDGVHHNGQIAACGVFESYGNVKTACGEPMLLVFDASCADCNIRKKIGKITMVIGI